VIASVFLEFRLVLSENGGGVKGILLGELGLNLLNDGRQVGDILL
jgi:hypothetical protein